jgi:pyruvate dehydrogenase E2 component (dihydrolipoamide acetyltransferase)
MAIDYVMPKLAMAMNEGTIAEWLVAHGEKVEKGQPLATIETEKVAYDVESPEAGYLSIVVEAGETVPCDTLIARFADTAEAALAPAAEVHSDTPATPDSTAQAPAAVASAPTAVPTTPAGPGTRIKASPLARKLAGDAGFDLSQITGTSPGGRIVKRDVLAFEAEAPGRAVPGGEQILAEIPLTGMRGTIASRMQESLHGSAQLTSNWESDITDLLARRQSFVQREETLGTRVSFNAFLIRALVYAIRRVPMANACLVDGKITVYGNVNMGIAISMPGASDYDSGLMVGVLRGVEGMGVVEIDLAMRALVQRVRSGNASAEDLSGSTITLSSTAGIGPPGLMSTPVLNMPNVALLGPSTPIERPVIVDGEMVVRTLLPLSLTFDHRALDGDPAARFMAALHDALEHPELLLA